MIVAQPCPVISNQNIARGIYDIWAACPQAAQTRAGQFVMVRCAGFTLRRPISVCEIDAAGGRLRLVVEIRGEGTGRLAGVRAGESLDILAPLGNGFSLGDTGRRAVFVGGGIGTPPLLEAAKPFGANADVFLGFRSAGAVILTEDFARQGNRVTVATEDGTAGEKGLITAPLARRLDDAPCDVIAACGPRPMLAAVAAMAMERRIPCFVSMEERMACGVGACLSCACRTRADDGGEQILHVCKHGPVFDAAKIIW